MDFLAQNTTDYGGGSEPLLFVLLGVMYLVFALLPAFVARRKGQPFILWFVFALFCWVPAMASALLMSSDRDSR